MGSTDTDTSTVAVKEAFTETDEVKTIELDVAYGNTGADDTLEQALFDMTKDTDITYHVVNPKGPGGGNPVLKFTGPDRQLRNMLRTQYLGGIWTEDDVAFLMGDEGAEA